MAAVTDGRRERRRRTTRSKLLRAARELISEGGFDTVTVAEVTARADVGFGTFYGYFASKDALLRGVVVDALERIGATNDALTATLDDPAEVVAVAIRHTLAAAEHDPVWAAFLARLAFSDETELWQVLRTRMRRDVRRGIAQGRFRGERADVVAHMIGASVLAVLRARTDGTLPKRADAELAASVLVLLGVPEHDADEIAHRPLPPLPLHEEDA